jgi:hypothetical protein
LLTGVLSLAREPARLTLRVWELGLSSAATAAKLGLELLDPERSSGADFAQHRPPAQQSPPAPQSPPPARQSPPASQSPPARREPSGNGAPAPALPDELIPDHVDEEVVLVAEVAEEGAEDGAGPELRVDPPWDGYERMTAPEIRDRLAAADAALAAAVSLYETTHKSRRTVLDAAERALKG